MATYDAQGHIMGYRKKTPSRRWRLPANLVGEWSMEEPSELVRAIDQRGQEIIRLREAGLSLAVIGKQMGISRERVRQLGGRALRQCDQLAAGR